VQIVDWLIKYESCRQNGDPTAWKWLRRLLGFLKAEGMSSDETDIKGYQVVYRVKTREWRHPDIALCMESIDEQRLGVPTFSKKGSKPEKRTRDIMIKSKRPHVDGLPRVCYNPQWLSNPINEMRVQVSDEQFQWMRWRGQTALGVNL
jgi:hypothetical protein